MLNYFWTYQETIDLAVFRSTNSPLGFITTAVILPTDWKITFADANACLKTDRGKMKMVGF
ncbi:MAG: hypothetical protein V7K48_19515 [Nostoc sp.]|uniref:hypothetical protein n=1 Tax=Nostoc sp. TaxID=1180 RepID=UPI002FFAB4CA